MHILHIMPDVIDAIPGGAVNAPAVRKYPFRKKGEDTAGRTLRELVRVITLQDSGANGLRVRVDLVFRRTGTQAKTAGGASRCVHHGVFETIGRGTHRDSGKRAFGRASSATKAGPVRNCVDVLAQANFPLLLKSIQEPFFRKRDERLHVGQSLLIALDFRSVHVAVIAI